MAAVTALGRLLKPVVRKCDRGLPGQLSLTLLVALWNADGERRGAEGHLQLSLPPPGLWLLFFLYNRSHVGTLFDWVGPASYVTVCVAAEPSWDPLAESRFPRRLGEGSMRSPWQRESRPTSCSCSSHWKLFILLS